MTQYYEPEFKKKIVRLHLEEGRSLKGLASEYGVSKASISNWTKQFTAVPYRPGKRLPYRPVACRRVCPTSKILIFYRLDSFYPIFSDIFPP